MDDDVSLVSSTVAAVTGENDVSLIGATVLNEELAVSSVFVAEVT